MLLRWAAEEKDWKPHWDERMVRHGPGGFVTYSTLDAFEAFQAPFEITGIHIKSFLSIEPTGNWLASVFT